MAQFDVYRNLNGKTYKAVPYLLDVQVGFLDILATRVVVPLILADKVKAAQRLNPEFVVEDREVVMSTAELAGIPVRALRERILSLKDQCDEIIAALDMFFTGV